jgi:photosynthetic reaction center cytochrome c subunit
MKTSQSLLGVSFALAAVAVIVAGLLWKPTFVMARDAAPAHSPARRNASAHGRTQASLAEQETAQTKVPAAGDAYMNVQVLKDIPSNELIPSMRYITAALGVECSFCHDTKHFDSDDKSEKNTARNMIKMMFAINKDNFNGRREVTCYTCHRGAAYPANIPTLAAAGMMSGSPSGAAGPTGATAGQVPSAEAGGATPSAPMLPNTTVDAILAKYTDALGGQATIQKITTLKETGSVEFPGRDGHPGMHAPAEVLRKAPAKALVLVYLPNGDQFRQGYNGTAGWQQPPGRSVEDLSGDDLVRIKEWASFIPGMNLKQDFSRVQLAGSERIGDHDAYRVIAIRKGGGQVRFYFDAQSGLLLRSSGHMESPLGDLPQDTDYADYRQVSGVKVPFSVTVARVEGPTIYKWEQIQANVPAEDTRFEKPAAKPQQ